jgi:hypothetical protein
MFSLSTFVWNILLLGCGLVISVKCLVDLKYIPGALFTREERELKQETRLICSTLHLFAAVQISSCVLPKIFIGANSKRRKPNYGFTHYTAVELFIVT